MAKKPQSMKIFPGPGFRIRREIPRPATELVERLGAFDTADMSDLMNRLYTMNYAIKNQVNSKRIAGPACTVKVFPGDNVMVHKALDIARPGDIVVVDAGASSMNGLIGDLISTKAMHRGIAGFVIDGLIRDIAGVREVGMPIYARGITPIGPLHRGPGEINFPVSCGGIVVNPGDIICGDADGVVVVRQDFVEELLEKLVIQQESLRDYVAGVRKGIFSNEWVDNILDAHNCQYLD